jgi:transposase InsO family protein
MRVATCGSQRLVSIFCVARCSVALSLADCARAESKKAEPIVVRPVCSLLSGAFQLMHRRAQKRMMIYVATCGAPDVLHSDNGKEFVAKLLTEACKRLGIVRMFGKPYYPEVRSRHKVCARNALIRYSLRITGPRRRRTVQSDCAREAEQDADARSAPAK